MAPPRKREKGGENASLTARKLLDRNDLIFQLKIRGKSFLEIASEMAVSERTARRAFAEYREVSMVSMRSEDPEELVWEILEKYRLAARNFYDVFEQAKGNHAARVGAMKGYVDVVEKEMKLRQACGLIPKRLGEIAIQINMRFVATTMRTVLEKYGDAIPDEAIEELVDALRGGVTRARAIGAAAVVEGD